MIGIDVAKDRLGMPLRPSGETFAVTRATAGPDQLVARRHTPTLRAVFNRLLDAGKPKDARPHRRGPHASPAATPSSGIDAHDRALDRQDSRFPQFPVP
jgi:hypothetical protein